MGLYDRNYMNGGGAGRFGDDWDWRSVIWILIGINVCFYFLIAPPGSSAFTELALTTGGIRQMKIYQFVTAAFLHADFSHIFFNMYGLYLFGGVAGPRLGGGRLLFTYLCGAVAGNLLFLLFNWHTPAILMGASGAVYAMMMAAAMCEPERRFVLILMPFTPIRITTMVVCYTILEVVLQMNNLQTGIAHLAHLGGFAGGYLYLKLAAKDAVRWDFLTLFRRRPVLFQGRGRDETIRFRPSPFGGGRVSPQELDALLDKVSREGINSLSEEELARLRLAREQMRGK